MEQDGSELVRLDPTERRLVRNFRIVNDVRQDTLLYFSDELVKLERLEIEAAAKNVFSIGRRKQDKPT